MLDVPAGDQRYESRSLGDLLFSFKGVISQSQFIVGIVLLLIADLILTLVLMVLLGVPLEVYFEPRKDVATAKLIAYAGLSFPFLAVGLKRLKTRGIPAMAGYMVLLLGFLVGIESYHLILLRLDFMDFFGWLPTLLYVLGLGWLFLECGVLPERKAAPDQ